MSAGRSGIDTRGGGTTNASRASARPPAPASRSVVHESSGGIVRRTPGASLMPFGKKKTQQIAPEFEVGPSMAETRTRSRKLIVAGVVLALCAGVGSYVLISRAQQSAG